MSSCPMETNECDDAESVVVASSTISDGFSTPASSRSIPFCVRISGLSIFFASHIQLVTDLLIL
jgi:hypothetical protein